MKRRLAFLPVTPGRCLAVALVPNAAGNAPSAHAQDEVFTPSPGMNGLSDAGRANWGLGIGIGATRKPYAGIGTTTQALPLIFFDNRYVRALGSGGDLKLPSAGPLAFGLRLRYAPKAYNQSDAPILNGMADRKGGLLAGVGTGLRIDYGVLTAEVLNDVSGHSKGSQVKLGFAAPMRFGAFSVTPQIAAQWLDSKTVDYNYGVRASEVRAGRPKYDGRSTLNTELGVRTGYALTRDQTLTLDIGTTWFGSGVTNSPLVERNWQSSVRLGYIHRF